MRELAFAKGHGTLNDFVVLSDPDSTLDLTDDEIRFLCDRRAGIGADGVLIAVRADHVAEWDGDPDVWFMDYRNADASLAEMCGNGLRVFLRFLLEEGLAEGPEVFVATRAGLRAGTFLDDGRIAVTMGPATVAKSRVEVVVGSATWPGVPVSVGNPHVVSLLRPGESLESLALRDPPRWRPTEAFPHGVNAEFVEVLESHRLRLRVFERGSGETWSCGTGTVAAAAAVADLAGLPAEGRYAVEVPGGLLEVDLDPEESLLVGPAVIVARGTVQVDPGPEARKAWGGGE